MGGCEAAKRFVERKHFIQAVGGNGKVILHLHALPSGRAPLRMMGARVIDKNLTHDVGSDADEVGAAVPGDVFAHKSKVCLVNEGGWLQGMVWALSM
jgi:hypothetical protein